MVLDGILNSSVRALNIIETGIYKVANLTITRFGRDNSSEVDVHNGAAIRIINAARAIEVENVLFESNNGYSGGAIDCIG